MRVMHLLLCPVFAWFASLQFNDPDTLPWVLVYGLVAALCMGGVLGKTTVVGSTVLAVACISWATVLSFEVSDHIIQRSGTKGMLFELADDEVAREVGGLGLAGMWCIISAIHAVRRKRWKGDA